MITGIHENMPRVVNTLYGETGTIRADTWKRLPGSYHGFDCTLTNGFRPGMGQYLPDRFFWTRELETDEDK